MYTDYRYNVEEHMMQSSMADFMYRVYGWMTAALSVSAGVAYYVSTQPMLMQAIFKNYWALIAIFIGQLALVSILSFFLMRISYSVGIILFMLYAASLGLTLSAIFIVYDIGSIYQTFFITAGMFGLMCLYGYTTKADLSTVRSIGTMALIGLILGFIVNAFLQNSTLDYVLSGIGVLVFTALTAADMQKIKQMGYQLLSMSQEMRKVALLGAMVLYLDFINLFLMLLTFTGKQRD